MNVVEVLDAINALHPFTLLTTSEAVIFLGISVTKMKRLRKAGDGPAYIQCSGVHAKGFNQTCLYGWSTYQRMNLTHLDAVISR